MVWVSFTISLSFQNRSMCADAHGCHVLAFVSTYTILVIPFWSRATENCWPQINTNCCAWVPTTEPFHSTRSSKFAFSTHIFIFAAGCAALWPRWTHWLDHNCIKTLCWLLHVNGEIQFPMQAHTCHHRHHQTTSGHAFQRYSVLSVHKYSIFLPSMAVKLQQLAIYSLSLFLYCIQLIICLFFCSVSAVN